LSSIHPTAVIDATAELDSSVEVGPYAVIGSRVCIGSGSRVGPHAVIRGPTTIGANNRVFQFASVGEDPQDKKYGGEETFLEIGDGNVVRECATLHRGTAQDAGITRIGNGNLFMAYTHVAHDCHIGDNVIMANAASLAGHIEVQDWAILGGFTIVHQFCRIGAHCFCAMGSVITKDVPPFLIIGGHPAAPRGINAEGLRRRDIGDDVIQSLRAAYRALYMSNRKLEDAVEIMRDMDCPQVDQLVEFVQDRTRSIVR
jgi:UDP-N-acetylglucosamine acyltransferase